MSKNADDRISELIEVSLQLRRYITRYDSRSLTVEQALGMPGTRLLSRLFELAESCDEERSDSSGPEENK